MLDHEEQNELTEESETTKIASKSKRTLTNEEIVGQTTFVFLFACVGNISKTLSFIAHNLALYPEYQEKLIAEIDDVLEKHVKKILEIEILKHKY